MTARAQLSLNLVSLVWSGPLRRFQHACGKKRSLALCKVRLTQETGLKDNNSPVFLRLPAETSSILITGGIAQRVLSKASSSICFRFESNLSLGSKHVFLLIAYIVWLSLYCCVFSMKWLSPQPPHTPNGSILLPMFFTWDSVPCVPYMHACLYLLT